MIQAIVAILGAVGGLLILRFFDKASVNKHQAKLEEKVAAKDKEIAGLEGEQRQEDKETENKVNEIEKEQSKDLSSSDLVDFFRNRK